MRFVIEPNMEDLEYYMDSDVFHAFIHELFHVYIREDVSGLVFVLDSPYRMDICRNFNVLQNKIISQSVEFFGYSSDFFREEIKEIGNDC